MERSPLTRSEIAALGLLTAALLALITLGVLRDRRDVPRVSFIAAQASPPYRIDLNRASAEELALLRGIGPAKAQAIAAWRAQYGPFKSVDELRNVPGISDRIVKGLGDTVTLGPAGADAPPANGSQ